ncbi:putative nonribosomal peptide synthetase [Athelia psychrophila]|uniref:Nonribosomal peptide synthetase n=1 Tax=Athelia psychrophila TaxID=1759441 RepID=A0A166W0E6_9AGAM|nr:putative nonribosomal peptide synthetase [Fibularhizoctonia sp. CBS 109695]
MSNKPAAVYPPLDGTILLPDLVDFNLEHNPDLPAFVYSDAPGSLTKISYLEYGRAAHRVGHVFRPGRAGPEGKVVALIANLDTLLYAALVVGMIRAGVVPFPISPRNSAEAVVSMLQKTGCHTIITTESSLGDLMNETRALTPQDFCLSIQEAPALAQCFPELGRETAEHAFKPYPARSTPLDVDELLFYLHSSGSTGIPKPIAQTSRTMLGWCALDAMVDYRQISCMGAMHLPAFHALGTIMHLIVPLSSVTTVALYPPTSRSGQTEPPVIPTSDNIPEHCKRTGVKVIVAVPSFLEKWIQETESIEWLRTLQFVVTTGGPLAPKIGDALAHEGVILISVYGGTEFGTTTTIFDALEDRSPEDWIYMRFSDKINIRWVPQEDGTFENQFLDNDVHSVSVRNVPGVNGYATSDCWEPHPTKPNFWRLVGRLDDMLILASGENVVPAPMENTVMSSPLVSGVVIFGRARNQVGILVEPSPEGAATNTTEFRNRIWPVVEEANKDAPAYSRIFKEMILIADTSKPMLRVGKGTVAKKATLKAYEPEINALYEAADGSANDAVNFEPPKSWSSTDLELWLAAQSVDIQSQGVIDASVDIFSQGFDSLSATSLRNRIMGALRSSSDPRASSAVTGIAQNFVFSYPTIKKLARRIADLVRGDINGTESATSAVEDMIEKYSTALAPIRRSAEVAPEDAVVLLTGSTGGLGSFLLEALLKDTRVRKIYAYNRPSSSFITVRDRQTHAFKDKGLDTQLLESGKLVYLEADSALPKLGLSDHLYDELLSSVKIIIHNAWRLDFNLSLASFEPNIRGTRNLIDLAAQSRNAATLRFLFTSSIATSQGWDHAKGDFPEEVKSDVSTALGGGYGEAKYVCDRILERSGLNASCFRIGQIAGGKANGAWATSDWVPAFVKSSLALGALPDAQGFASWLPVNTVSQVILDVAFAEEPPLALNIVHPRPILWSTVIKHIRDALQRSGLTSQALPLLHFTEWFDALERRSRVADEQGTADIPAIKILEFFRGMALADAADRNYNRANVEAGGMSSLSTAVCQAASPALREAKPINSEDAELWVRYWVSKGFFSR